MEKNINVTSEGKAINSMMQLLEIHLEMEIETRRIIKKIGLKEFLFLIELLNVTDEIKEKVKALKEVGDEYGK